MPKRRTADEDDGISQVHNDQVQPTKKNKEKTVKKKCSDRSDDEVDKEPRRIDKKARKEERKKKKREEERRQQRKVIEQLGGPESQSLLLPVSTTTNTSSRESPSSTAATSVDDAPLPAQKPQPAPAATHEDVRTNNTSAYTENSILSALPQSEIDRYLSSHSISITDPSPTTTPLRPIMSFSYLPYTDDSLNRPLKSFSEPTPIQAAAWPFLFHKRDMIGIAETGSGKTLAFGVPCIRRLTSRSTGRKGRSRVRAVIIAPTRELAIQVHKQIVEIAGELTDRVACIYGGVSKEEQKTALKTAAIVVATPGRLKDHVGEGALELKHVEFLVLDEADRMLDKGFEEDIKQIVSSMPDGADRQTLMFTATWPISVQELAATFMISPVTVNIGGSPSSELRANPRIKQIVEVVEPRNKEQRMLQILNDHQHNEKSGGGKKNDKILIFCLYKKEAARVERFISSRGFRVGGIHGDMSQAQRIQSLDAFRSGNVPLLVATDVAARGLDIPAVKLVLNVTFPLTAEDYVHRIGRTGRAGADGVAITLFTELEKGLSGSLINVLKSANQPVPEALLKFGATVKKKQHEAYGAFYRDTEGMKPATKIKF